MNRKRSMGLKIVFASAETGIQRIAWYKDTQTDDASMHAHVSCEISAQLRLPIAAFGIRRLVGFFCSPNLGQSVRVVITSWLTSIVLHFEPLIGLRWGAYTGLLVGFRVGCASIEPSP